MSESESVISQSFLYGLKSLCQLCKNLLKGEGLKTGDTKTEQNKQMWLITDTWALEDININKNSS